MPVIRFESHANHVGYYADSAARVYCVGLHNKVLICGFIAIHRRVTWNSCKAKHSY